MRFSPGFTLIELIVTIAVAAILLGVAVPSFQETIKNNRMAANVNEFIAALNLARSEAIKRGVPVTVCKGNAAACNNAARWDDGWIVFADGAGAAGTVNAGTGACLPTEDCILRVYPALDATYSFGGSSPAMVNRVTYDPKGFSAAGHLVMCDDRGFGENGRAIVIARTGRAQTMKATQSTATACI